MIKNYIKYRFGWLRHWRTIATVLPYLLALTGCALLAFGVMGALFVPIAVSLKLCGIGLVFWLPLLIVDFLAFTKRNPDTD